MFYMIYCSKSPVVITPEVAADILQKAQTNNKEKNISGTLFYAPKFFLQVLEGERDEVNRLFLKIANDPRHESIEIIDAGDWAHRRFDDWTMGIASHKSVNKDVYKKFGMNEKFDPYTLTAADAYDFFMNLRNTARIFNSPSEAQ